MYKRQTKKFEGGPYNWFPVRGSQVFQFNLKNTVLDRRAYLTATHLRFLYRSKWDYTSAATRIRSYLEGETPLGAVVSLPISSYAGQAIQEVDLFGTYGTQWRIQCRALAAVRPRKVQNTLYILIRNACQIDIQPHIDRRCARWTKVGLNPCLLYTSPSPRD